MFYLLYQICISIYPINLLYLVSHIFTNIVVLFLFPCTPIYAFNSLYLMMHIFTKGKKLTDAIMALV